MISPYLDISLTIIPHIQASSLDIQIQKHVLGGTPDIRSELASSTSMDDPERIQVFLASAQNSTSPVLYKLSSTVWDFLALRMGYRDSDNSIVANFNRLLSSGYLADGESKDIIAVWGGLRTFYLNPGIYLSMLVHACMP